MAYTRIPLGNKWRIVRKTLSGPRKPKFASLFVTRKCNLACPYCWSILHDYEDIKTPEWKAIIDRLHGWGVRIFSLTGGEPSVRRDIFDLVQYIAREKKSVCWTISNFKTMTRGKIDAFAGAGLEFLTCSLDSLEGEAEKSQPQVFDQLDYAKSRGIVCSTLTVVTKKNIHEVPAIMHAAVGRGILFDMGLYQHVGGIFSPEDDSLKVTDPGQLEGLRKALKREKLRSGLVAPSWGYLSRPLRHYLNLDWKCSSTRDNYLVVNNDGRMMTCQEHLNGMRVLDIADLGDPRWRQEKKRTVEACRGCFYGCYYQKENISPWDAALGLYSLLRT